MIQWARGLEIGGRWRGGSQTRTNGGGTANGTVNGAANGTSKRNGGSEPPGAGITITRILDAYDRKRDEVNRDQAALEAERNAFRERADALIDQIIEPTLRSVGRDVLERGHHWSVEDRVDIQAQPAVACLFRPASSLSATGPASELTFRCLFPERLMTSATVFKRGQGIELPARSHVWSTVTPNLVRAEVARFMEQVLEATAV